MRINLFGQRNNLGAGRHFGEFADAMRSLRLIGGAVFEFDYFNADDQRQCLETAGSNDINIHFFNVNAAAQEALPGAWPRLPGRNINWAVFEGTKLTPSRFIWLAAADLVFVPSEWGKRVLIDNGIAEDAIEVVPEGVDPAKFHPLARNSYTSREDDIYRVLVVSKFEKRKGFPELLDGYAKAFGNDPTAKLLLKSDSLYLMPRTDNAYENNLVELQRQAEQAGIENVIYLNGELSDDDLAHLYNGCDVLLFPSRAEGWGLPLIEAIATGMPVATTCYSGHSEFLAPVNGKFGSIDHRLIPIGETKICGEWAYAEPDDIASTLVEMRQNKKAYETMALEASEVIRRDFSWQRAAERCVEVLAARYGLFEISLDL